MKKILYYSDCSSFAGCEQMLSVLLNSKDIKTQYKTDFLYRHSEAYCHGMKKRIVDTRNMLGIRLLDPFLGYEKKKSILGQKLAKLLGFVLKYPFCIVNMLRIYQTVKGKKYDLVHINNGGYPGGESFYAAVFAFKLSGIPKIVYIVNNQAIAYQGLKRFFDYPLDLLVKKFVTLFITASESARKRLKSVLNLDEHQVTNLNNGILKRQTDMSRENARRKLKVAENIVLVGIVANLEDRKGVIYAIKAFEKLKDQKNLLLMIEGEGVLRSELVEYVAKNDVKNVVFIERQKNIMNFINAIDVFLLPSIANEDFPNVILEAMSYGKAVIGTKIAGIPEQISHMKDGILINPESIDEIVESVLILSQDITLREKLGNEAKIKFDRNFTADAAVKRYIDLYNKVIELKPQKIVNLEK